VPGGREDAHVDADLGDEVLGGGDDAATVCRDFGTWLGANRYQLVAPAPAPGAAPNPMEDMP
jgi:hypothetical protein